MILHANCLVNGLKRGLKRAVSTVDSGFRQGYTTDS
jgi:hypothetical protein